MCKVLLFCPHLCLRDLWPLFDSRYDIDSKSPDLAKHVSEDLGSQLNILPLNVFELLSVHVCNI